MTIVINQEVQVNAFYFAGRTMRTYPRSIEYNGHSVTFLNGLRYLVQRGTEALQLFDMHSADGLIYRLQRRGDCWQLLATKGGY